MTESGVAHPLHKLAPGKRSTSFPRNTATCSECPYIAAQHAGEAARLLLRIEPRVEISEELMRRALVPLERMLALQ